jgi:hypothetical protein
MSRYAEILRTTDKIAHVLSHDANFGLDAANARPRGLYNEYVYRGSVIQGFKAVDLTSARSESNV